MKKIIKILSFLVGVSVIILFVGQPKARPNPANVLLERLEVFMQAKDEADLEEALRISWDEFCVFYPGGSEPRSAYWAYEESAKKKFLEKKISQEKILPQANYDVIFLIFKGSEFQQYATKKQRNISQLMRKNIG